MDENIKKRILNLSGNKLLTNWEKDFCESILGSLKKWGKLTDKQHNLLQKIEGQYTLQKMQDHETWQAGFTSEMRKRMKIAANYYWKYAGYFGDVACKVLNSDGFIPTEKQYNKMCENKYAKGVIQNALCDPQFAPSTFAMIRSGNAYSRMLRGQLLLVVEHSIDVKSHAKGAKPVCVLPVGSSKVIWLEERFLKAPRQKRA